MKFLLFLIGLLWGFGKAQGQNIVFTKDSFYVASGIMAKGMAIELFELDTMTNQPLLVHRIAPKELVELVVFKSAEAQERFLSRTDREGISTYLVPDWPDWLVNEVANGKALNASEVLKRLGAGYVLEEKATPAGKHLIHAGEHLRNSKNRQLQIVGVLVVTSLASAVLWPIAGIEVVGIVSAAGGIAGLVLWYDGLDQLGKAGDNLQKAGALLGDKPSF